MSKKSIISIIISVIIFFLLLSYLGDHKIGEFSRKAYLVEDIAGRDESKFQNPVIFHRFLDEDSNYYNIYTKEKEGFKTLNIGDSVFIEYSVHYTRFTSKYDTFFINYKMIN